MTPPLTWRSVPGVRGRRAPKNFKLSPAVPERLDPRLVSATLPKGPGVESCQHLHPVAEGSKFDPHLRLFIWFLSNFSSIILAGFITTILVIIACSLAFYLRFCALFSLLLSSSPQFSVHILLSTWFVSYTWLLQMKLLHFTTLLSSWWTWTSDGQSCKSTMESFRFFLGGAFSPFQRFALLFG